MITKSSYACAGINDDEYSSLFVLISRQVVSPPYFRYSLPETGMEPLDPRHLTIITILSFQVILGGCPKMAISRHPCLMRILHKDKALIVS